MNAQNQGFQQQYQYPYQGQQNMNRPFQQGNNQNKAGQQQQQQQTPARNRKPIHTAFFSNILYNCPNEKFQEFAQSFGEVLSMYSLIPTKGIAFVTYSDIRNAQKAVEKGNEAYLMNRPVKTNYANKSHFPHQDPTSTCATILVKSLSSPSKMTIHEVIAKMNDFGEINTAFPVEGQPGTFVVKYFNIKDARKAMENNLPQIGSETASLEYKLEDEDNPDIQSQPRPNVPYPNMPQPAPMYGMPNMGYPQQQPNIQPPQYPRMPQQTPQSQQQPPAQGQQPPPPPPQYYGAPPHQPYYGQMPPQGQVPPPSYGMNPQQPPQGQGTVPPAQAPPQLSPNAVEKLKNLQMQMKKKHF